MRHGIVTGQGSVSNGRTCCAKSMRSISESVTSSTAMSYLQGSRISGYRIVFQRAVCLLLEHCEHLWHISKAARLHAFKIFAAVNHRRSSTREEPPFADRTRNLKLLSTWNEEHGGRRACRGTVGGHRLTSVWAKCRNALPSAAAPIRSGF